MKAQQQIPRNALGWTILSMFTLVLPHIERIPPWVLAVYFFAALWRILVYRGRWSFPRWPVKLGLIFAGFAGILLNLNCSLSAVGRKSISACTSSGPTVMLKRSVW